MELEYQRKIDEMHTALVGDNYGNDGLVKKVKKLEDEIDEHNKIKYKFMGAGVALSCIGSGLMTWLIKHF